MMGVPVLWVHCCGPVWGLSTGHNFLHLIFVWARNRLVLRKLVLLQCVLSYLHVHFLDCVLLHRGVCWLEEGA